ncbi:hypothetical protein PR048_009227 [Dryococelus australis]|uniref:PiggyBac transposable element-derived protein domain-containing protein n=1 Tax=Dryococelus australis TaxID=614101 RepID=A0ABQ9HZB0_9NEOP|nr:hypothetical protein PR048_009227 [Dryococelus australis]
MAWQNCLSNEEVYRLPFEEIPSDNVSEADPDDTHSDPTFVNNTVNDTSSVRHTFHDISSSSDNESKKQNALEVGLGSRVVETLTDSLEGKNHILYMDNFYLLYLLFSSLRSTKQIYACGTVNPKRKYLPNLKQQKQLQRGEFEYRVSDNDVAIYRWKDNRADNMISTCHDPAEVLLKIKREKMEH